MRQGNINQIADTAVQLKARLTALGVFPRAPALFVAAASPRSSLSRPPGHHRTCTRTLACRTSGAAGRGVRHSPPGNGRRAVRRNRTCTALAGLRLLRDPAKPAVGQGPSKEFAYIEPAVIERLVSGPGQDDTDMRLVAVTGLAAGAAAETAAFCWVRDNVPGAGPILNATYAGRITAGAASPVYLITFQLAGSRDPGARVHPAGGADEVPS